jgi:penicillin-binding protein 1A
LSDWLFKHKSNRSLINWMGLDSWLDSTIAGSWQGFLDRWNAASSFFARFRLSGWKRVANELLSEGLTLGTGGLVVLYALAMPAFHDADESKIFATGKYSVRFLDRHGTEIGKRGILHSDEVPLEEIPDILIKATLATEDRRFFEHYGIDVFGTIRALTENLRAGATVQGGSTLTQQLAKNLFLSSERSLERKIKELFLSFWLESRLTKRQILKLYLDRAYMGGGAFGVEAASQFYFGKSVRNITLAEAAMLAGMFKAPTKYAPHLNVAAARGRANEVLTNLVEAGYLTAGQVHAARISPARHIETRALYSPDWFMDWAFEEIQRVAEGRGQYVLVARTTLDLTAQQSAEQALVTTVRQHGRSVGARSGAMVVMETDGAVRALVGGLDYGESQFNRATQARRQPGSSFKVYVYAAALERLGYTPNTIVRDNRVTCGNWSPQNYDGGSGSGRAMPLAHALAISLNTVAVDLSLKVDRERVIELADRLGVHGIKKSCSMALGDYGITPLQHTSGFAAFANGGFKATPYAILDIHTAKGELIYSRERDEPPPARVLAPKIAEQMNQMLQGVVTQGTGKRAQLDFTYTAGKTGTSSSYRDAWFVGFSGQYVTGVWIGNDDFRPMSRVTGGTIPAVAWHSFMSVAHTSMDIPQIPGLPLHPTQVAERQRIAEERRTDSASAAGASATGARRHSLMSDAARNALKKLAQSLRTASGTTPDATTPESGDGAAPPADPMRRTDIPASGAGAAASLIVRAPTEAAPMRPQ